MNSLMCRTMVSINIRRQHTEDVDASLLDAKSFLFPPSEVEHVLRHSFSCFHVELRTANEEHFGPLSK
jgi:hypothetical protein